MQNVIKCFSNFVWPGEDRAMLQFIVKESLKVSELFIIYQELKPTTDYGDLNSKGAKD